MRWGNEQEDSRRQNQQGRGTDCPLASSTEQPSFTYKRELDSLGTLCNYPLQKTHTRWALGNTWQSRFPFLPSTKSKR